MSGMILAASTSRVLTAATPAAAAEYLDVLEARESVVFAAFDLISTFSDNFMDTLRYQIFHLLSPWSCYQGSLQKAEIT